MSTDQLFLLGIGTTVSVAAHALVQWLGARGAGLTLRPTLGWRTPEVRSIMRLAVPSIGSASLEVGIFWAAIIVAGLIPGGVLALQMGVLFSALPFAVAARPIGIALLPRLTRLRRVDSPRLFEEYRAALGLILLLSLPATFGLVTISGSLAKAVAVGTMSTPEGVHLMRVAIAYSALAIVPGAVFELARQGAYSARDARSPFYGGVIRAVVIAPGIAAAAFAEGTNTLLILGLATGIADAAAAGYLDRRVRALAAAGVRVGALAAPSARHGGRRRPGCLGCLRRPRDARRLAIGHLAGRRGRWCDRVHRLRRRAAQPRRPGTRRVWGRSSGSPPSSRLTREIGRARSASRLGPAALVVHPLRSSGDRWPGWVTSEARERIRGRADEPRLRRELSAPVATPQRRCRRRSRGAARRFRRGYRHAAPCRRARTRLRGSPRCGPLRRSRRRRPAR